MPGRALLFIIVDDVPERAHRLKSLIEFMDVPQVQIAAPETWRSGVGDRRLAAVFLSRDLEQERIHNVIADLGEHDPNVPIVLVDSGENKCH